MVRELKVSDNVSIQMPGTRLDVLYEHFKECIINQHWLPDQQLNIDRLAAQYDVSITPVREALSRLAADRLVVAAPHRGYRVAPVPSRQRVEELSAMRLLVEPYAAYGAARRATLEDLTNLRTAYESLSQLHAKGNYEDMRPFAAHDRAFHRSVLQANRNAALCEMYDLLGYEVSFAHIHYTRALPSPREVFTRHQGQVLEELRVIFQAIAGGDPDGASNAMRVHVEQADIRFAELCRVAPSNVDVQRKSRT